jgi:hypothetical protein
MQNNNRALYNIGFPSIFSNLTKNTALSENLDFLNSNLFIQIYNELDLHSSSTILFNQDESNQGQAQTHEQGSFGLSGTKLIRFFDQENLNFNEYINIEFWMISVGKMG